jgi:hypothetical protein
VQEATVITDDWLNDLQENICMAIEGAGMTLTKGDATQLLLAIGALNTNVAKTYVAKQTFNGAAGDTNGALETTAVPTNYKLLWKFAVGGGMFGRLYSTAVVGQGLVITTNAAWNGTNWTPDITGVASKSNLTDATFRVRYNPSVTSAVAFADSAFTAGASLDIGLGRLSLADGTAPAVADSIPNTLTKANIPKAWSTWDVSGTTVSNVKGVHISGVTFNNPGGIDPYFEITFASSFADQDYAVVVNTNSGAPGFCCPTVTAANKVQVRTSDAAGGQISTWGSTTKFSLIAMGRQ